MIMHLKLKASYRLAALLAIAHSAAIAAVLLCDLRLDVRFILVLAVGASFLASIRRAALLIARTSIVALEWNEDGAINFQTRDGTWHSARLMPTTFVTPTLTVINLRALDAPRVRHVVSMSDSMDNEAYRRLRVRLQWDRTGYA
jgi:toxin CptA